MLSIMAFLVERCFVGATPTHSCRLVGLVQHARDPTARAQATAGGAGKGPTPRALSDGFRANADRQGSQGIVLGHGMQGFSGSDDGMS